MVYAVYAEILDKDFQPKQYAQAAARTPGTVVADCKSLWDTITMERVLLSDKRLSLEPAILRHELQQNIAAKWVKSEQMLADILTKELSGRNASYARKVFESNVWTFGPDARCPSTRGRKLAEPEAGERVQTQDEADALTVRMDSFIRKQETEEPDNTVDAYYSDVIDSHLYYTNLTSEGDSTSTGKSRHGERPFFAQLTYFYKSPWVKERKYNMVSCERDHPYAHMLEAGAPEWYNIMRGDVPLVCRT